MRKGHKPLTEDKISRLKELRKSGVRVKDIVKELNIGRSDFYYHIYKTPQEQVNPLSEVNKKLDYVISQLENLKNEQNIIQDTIRNNIQIAIQNSIQNIKFRELTSKENIEQNIIQNNKLNIGIDDWIDTFEASKISNRDITTIQRYCKKGKVIAKRDKFNRWIVNKTSLLEYLKLKESGNDSEWR